jgi:hypothetical protein
MQSPEFDSSTAIIIMIIIIKQMKNKVKHDG